MRVRFFVESVSNEAVTYPELGLLTDNDMGAWEGQNVLLDGKTYQIDKIVLALKQIKGFMDAEKHIYIREVE